MSVEFGIFGQQQVGQLAILVQVVNIVETGDQQDVLDFERHQRVETRCLVFKCFQLGDWIHEVFSAFCRINPKHNPCPGMIKGRVPGSGARPTG
jgi:hypothetical protein